MIAAMNSLRQSSSGYSSMDSQIPSIQPSPASRHPASQIPNFVQPLDPFAFNHASMSGGGNYAMMYNTGTQSGLQLNGGSTSRMPKSYGDVMQQNGVAVGEVPQSQVYGNGISGAATPQPGTAPGTAVSEPYSASQNILQGVPQQFPAPPTLPPQYSTNFAFTVPSDDVQRVEPAQAPLPLPTPPEQSDGRHSVRLNTVAPQYIPPSEEAPPAAKQTRRPSYIDGPAAGVKRSARVRRSVTDERNLATEDEVNKVIAKGIPKGKKRATEAGGASGKKKRKVSGKAGSGMGTEEPTEFIQQVGEGNSNGAQLVRPFISTLFRMLEGTDTSSDVGWDDSGGILVVPNDARFAANSMRKFFPKGSAKTFLRLMQQFGFTRKEQALVDDRGHPNGAMFWNFQHPHFRRDAPQDLCKVQPEFPSEREAPKPPAAPPVEQQVDQQQANQPQMNQQRANQQEAHQQQANQQHPQAPPPNPSQPSVMQPPNSNPSPNSVAPSQVSLSAASARAPAHLITPSVAVMPVRPRKKPGTIVSREAAFIELLQTEAAEWRMRSEYFEQECAMLRDRGERLLDILNQAGITVIEEPVAPDYSSPAVAQGLPPYQIAQPDQYGRLPAQQMHYAQPQQIQGYGQQQMQ